MAPKRRKGALSPDVIWINSDDSDDSEADGGVFEVEKIVGRRFEKEDGRWEWLVRWAGYGEDEDTWEPIDHMVDAATGQELKVWRAFEARHPGDYDVDPDDLDACQAASGRARGALTGGAGCRKRAKGAEGDACHEVRGGVVIKCRPLDKDRFTAVKGLRVGGEGLCNGPPLKGRTGSRAADLLLSGMPYKAERRYAWAAGDAPAEFQTNEGVIVGRVVDVMRGGESKAMAALQKLCSDAGRVGALSEAVRAAGMGRMGAHEGVLSCDMRGKVAPWTIRDRMQDPAGSMMATPGNAVTFSFARDRPQPGQSTASAFSVNLTVRSAQSGRLVYDELVLPFTLAIADVVRERYPDVWKAWTEHGQVLQHGLPVSKVSVSRNLQTPVHKDKLDRAHAALLVLHDVDDTAGPPEGCDLWIAGLRLKLGHASLLVFDGHEPHCNTPISAGGHSARLAINIRV